MNGEKQRGVHMHLRCCVLLVSLLLSFEKESISQITINLKSAFELLEKQNLEIVQGNLNRLLAQQEYKDAKNALIPEISIATSRNYNLGLAFDQIAGQLVTGNHWSNTSNINMGFRSTIFQGFSKLNNIRLAMLNIESEGLSLLVKQKTLKLDLIANYFDALANTELFNASKRQLNLSSEQLRQIKIEYDLGMKTLVDISLVENQVANDELRVLSSKKNINAKLLSIKELLQIPLNDTLTLKLPNLTENINIDDYMKEPNNYNPEIALSKINIQEAELQLRTKKKLTFPSLSFSSGYGTNYSSERMDPIHGGFMNFGDQINNNRSLYLAVSLSMPILGGFRVKSDIAKSRINLEKSKNEFDRTAVSQQKIFVVTMQEYKQAKQEHKIYLQLLKSTETSYEAMKERYNLGMSSSIDLAKALLDYNLAELNLIRSKFLILYYQEIVNVLN